MFWIWNQLHPREQPVSLLTSLPRILRPAAKRAAQRGGPLPATAAAFLPAARPALTGTTRTALPLRTLTAGRSSHLPPRLRTLADPAGMQVNYALRDTLNAIEHYGDVHILHPYLTKQQERRAARHNLADVIDFTGIHPKVAEHLNYALTRQLRRTPQLREILGFVGSIQGRNQRLWKAFRAAEIKREFEREMEIRANRGQLRETDESLVRDLAQERLDAFFQKKLAPSSDAYAQTITGDYDVQVQLPREFLGIAINADLANNTKTLRQSLLNDVQHNFHPEGCHTILAVHDHEIGHLLDNLYGIRKSQEMRELYRSLTAFERENELSIYAKEGIDEFIAEGWAEYRNNPSPRPLAKAIGEIMEREIQRRRMR